MKKTQWKDAFRNIWKQKVSYLSVVLIALLGAGSFLSISYASDSMRENCAENYDAMKFRNIEVISTLLLTPGDLDALRGLDDVTTVEPVWQAGCNLFFGDKKARATFITPGEKINVPIVKEGKLPENVAECAVESRIAEALELRVGDVIENFEMTDDLGQYFALWEPMTVTGIVEHPDHLSKSLEETGYVIVVASAFDHDSLEGCCMKAEILVGPMEGVDRFSERAKTISAGMIGKIEALAKERTPIRDAAVKEKAYATIDEYEKNYTEFLAEARADLEKLKADPNASKDDIEDCESRISSYEESLAGLDGMRASVEETARSRWVVLDERGSPSFVQLLAGAENIGSLRTSFALMFIVISLLVVFATVSKMVDEQRTLIGTEKALGFYGREILQKYLLYGVSGTLIGDIAGALAARFVLEGIALGGYGKYVSVDITRSRFSPGITAVVIAVSVLLSAAAVWLACGRLVRTPVSQLMQPPAPKGKKGSSGAKKRMLPLYSRLILRNVRTDIRWIAVTVVSVAGCCALLVNGFTLRHGVTGCVEKQYGQVTLYDWEIECPDYAVEDVLQVLDDAGAESAAVYRTTLVTKIDDTGIADLFCGDLSEINKVFHLRDIKTGEAFTEADGILIQRKLAEVYGLDAGSEFELSDGLGKLVTVRVAGVFENYIGLPAAMSSAYYEETFGKPFERNMILVNMNGADETALAAKLDEMWEINSYGPVNRSSFRSSSTIIDAIVALLTFMAGLLAGVVLMNLTDLFFTQKKREMAIMLINGFSEKETVAYLLREIIPTTAVGIIVGIGAGAVMGYSILRSMEQSFVQFDRSVSFVAWGVGALIAIAFAAIVDWIVLRRIKGLKLTDAAV